LFTSFKRVQRSNLTAIKSQVLNKGINFILSLFLMSRFCHLAMVFFAKT